MKYYYSYSFAYLTDDHRSVAPRIVIYRRGYTAKGTVSDQRTLPSGFDPDTLYRLIYPPKSPSLTEGERQLLYCELFNAPERDLELIAMMEKL